MLDGNRRAKALSSLVATTIVLASIGFAPRADATSGGTVSLSIRTTILGEKAITTGRLSIGVARTVKLQHRAGSKWVTVSTGTSSRKGTFTLVTKRTAARGSYRALAPSARKSGIKLPQVISSTRALPVSAQKGTTTGPAKVVYNTKFTVAATFSPARTGRPLTLQRRAPGSTWTTVATGTQNSTGKQNFTRMETSPGTYSYRVVAAAWKGAPARTSTTYNTPVQAPQPILATTAVPKGSVDNAYTTRFRTNDNRAGTWQASGGQLPPGLKLSTTSGELVGVPTQAGTYPTTITYTDAWRQSVSRGITLTINPRVIGHNLLVSRSYDSRSPDESSYPVGVTADGSSALFVSASKTIVPQILSQLRPLYRWTAQTGTNEVLDAPTIQSGGFVCSDYSTSADGRYVACATGSSLIVLDTTTGEYETVPARTFSGYHGVAMTPDGSKVAYWKYVTKDGSDAGEVYVWDRTTGTNTIVSTGFDGQPSNKDSQGSLAITPNGRYVSFGSRATNLVPGLSGQDFHTYIRDTVAETTTLVSRTPAGTPTGVINTDSGMKAAFSTDGRYLAYATNIPGLVGEDTNETYDVYRYNTTTSAHELISKSSAGAVGNGDSGGIAMSADGARIAFWTGAINLLTDSGGPAPSGQVVIYDASTARIDQVSHAPDGTPASGSSLMMTPDGNTIVYASTNKTIAAGSSKQAWAVDTFLWRRN